MVRECEAYVECKAREERSEEVMRGRKKGIKLRKGKGRNEVEVGEGRETRWRAKTRESSRKRKRETEGWREAEEN